MTDEIIVLGSKTTFITGIHTVRNLYRRTHTVSCIASVGSVSNPSLANIKANVERAFRIRVKVVERNADGEERSYDLNGLSLVALIKEYYGYDESRPGDVELAVTSEDPKSAGLLYFDVASDSLTESGDFTVEIVDDLGDDGFASICEFGLKLTAV